LTIKVALVDDQDIIRLGVQQSLADVQHIIFLGGYETLESFCEATACGKADVVLLDDSLPDVDDLEAIRTVQERCPDVAIVLLGYRLTAHGIHQAIEAGASGVICKKEPVQANLVTGIQYAHAGKVFLSPNAALLAGRIGHLPLLTKCLYDVLKLMARGYLVQDMMRELGISRQAVYRRRTRLKEILDVDTNEQIVAEAIRRGLLSDDG
jgi:DNA-binding NarL/FixJ family response regulator